MSLPAGTRLGPYEVVSRLGAGGMGEVYRALDTRLDRIVALKVLPPDRVGDAEAHGRFAREAKAIAALNHPNICAIHDVGLATEGSPPYLVMELLEGQTLQERLLRGPIDVDQIVDFGVAIADALDTAHARGLIHRDLKPANILITTRGIAKILDFGLAKIVAAGPGDAAIGSGAVDVTRRRDEPLTELGTTVGTVAYMSPEQLRGELLDVRSDLFSFGLVLYEMATGQRAFGGATSAVVSAAILMQEPAAPSTARPDLPPRLEETILKALEKDRNVRCQSAAELRADLTRLRRQSGTQATRAVAMPPPTAIATMSGTGPTWSTAPAASSASRPSATGAPASSAAKPSRGFLIAVAVIAGAALMGGSYWLGLVPTPGTDQPPPSPPIPTAQSSAVPPSTTAPQPATAQPTPASPPAATPRPATTPRPTPTVDPAVGAAEPGRANTGPGDPPGPRGGRGPGRRGLGPNGPSLVSLLKTLPPLPFDLVSTAGDDHARELAMQLRTALTMGGWTSVNVSQAANLPPTGHQVTVFVPEPSPSAAALINWARRNGFNPDVRSAPRAPRLRIVIYR